MHADDFLYFFNGLISESSRSNVFIVKNQKVITASTGILPGITRKYVIEGCQGIFEVEERDSLAETLVADEVLITSSNQRIVHITQIDYQIFDEGKIGTVTKKLQELFLKKE